MSFKDIDVLPGAVVQPKLVLGPAGDRYEMEADLVAQQVVTAISSERQPAQRPERSNRVQRISLPSNHISVPQGPHVAPETEASILQARSGGQPISDEVRAPMERAFGADFSGVRVHADGRADRLNRSLQARAFTTGQNVFLRRGEYRPGSYEGQKLLAHELMHVVQQNGMRIKAATQARKISFNDYPNLGREEDITRIKAHSIFKSRNPSPAIMPTKIYQLMVDTSNRKFSKIPERSGLNRLNYPEPHEYVNEFDSEFRKDNALSAVSSSKHNSEVVQRVRSLGEEGETTHTRYGFFFKSDQTWGPNEEGIPVIVEVLEPEGVNTEPPSSAISKVDQYAKHRSLTVAFIFGINRKISDEITSIREFKSKNKKYNMIPLIKKCGVLAKHMENNKVAGGCIPIDWVPTTTTPGGYTFPFLECRSLLTLHKGVSQFHSEIQEHFNEPPVIRSMDSDIAHDPLLTGEASHPMSATSEEMQTALNSGLQKVSSGKNSILSGGYEWNLDEVTAEKLLNLGLFKNKKETDLSKMIDHIKALIAIVNICEHGVRKALAKVCLKSIYWPEPNTYMGLELRIKGAKESMLDAEKKPDQSQQQESTRYVRLLGLEPGEYKGVISTRKPLKSYFDKFIIFFGTAIREKRQLDITEIEKEVLKVRQTHLSIENVKKILEWHKINLQPENYEITISEKLKDCAEAIKATTFQIQ